MSDSTYAVIDVETTMNSPTGNKATPFHPSNHIVLRGIKRGDYNPVVLPGGSSALGQNLNPDTFPIKLLVGHNIGFDIHHMRAGKEIDETFLGTVGLWDTQLAEYLLSGQRTIMPSLNELAVKYGGKLKDDRVQKIFESGLGAEHVPEAMLKDYLKDDLLNTELVFVEQFKKAQEMGLIPLIVTQMDALAATIEMTYNGLAVDHQKLVDGVIRVRAEVADLHTRLQNTALLYGLRHFSDFNPGSTKQLSTLLFGGVIKEVEREPVGLTRSGKTTYKRVVKETAIPGMGFVPPGPKNGKGDYSTDDKTLQALLRTTSARRDFIQDLIEWREKNKQLGTYWEGLLRLAMPDGRIHHSLNHTVTRTGRLSSSEPNLQNVTNGAIKQVFVSRWGRDGVLVEADFKQLEMVELAILSGDKQLLADIRDGVDMHDALFMSMHGRPMKKYERKKFKRCSFCLVYGGGATAVSEQGGVSIGEAKRFIDTFYARYPGVKKYHDYLIDWAKREREYKGLKDAESGLPVGEAVWTAAATGRRYWFREYLTPWGTLGFSPSELKNYMVQGGATGDKVPLCVGKLYRVLRNHPTLKDKCLLVNTVHDSVMFDVHKDVLDAALTLIKSVMERTPEYYEEAFGSKLPLPLKVELSYGPNWLEQREVKYEQSVWRQAA